MKMTSETNLYQGHVVHPPTGDRTEVCARRLTFRAMGWPNSLKKSESYCDSIRTALIEADFLMYKQPVHIEANGLTRS
jgi:hypothetical protein